MVKTSSGEYYAHFEYQLDEPYVLKKEDILFLDGNLKECYYQGAKDIIVPSSFIGYQVKSIDDQAFRQNLESVVFENGIESIGGFGWNNISKIELPKGLKVIEKQAFVKNELADVRIPSSVIRIEAGAFGSCEIEKVELSVCLKYVSGFGSNKISELLFPASLDTIGVWAFSNNSIKEVILSKNVKVIEESAFFKNQIERIEWSELLVQIGAKAFQQNDLLEVILPKKVQVLEHKPFVITRLRNCSCPNLLNTLVRRALKIINFQ